MKLFIMRHGDALPAVTTDCARPLSPKGKQQAQQAVSFLAKKNVQPVSILASPLLRAQETAQIVQQDLGLECETIEALTPESPPADILALVCNLPIEAVLLISHQPLVSRLIALLTGEQVFLDTANIACVDLPHVNTERLCQQSFTPQEGELLWVI